VPERPQFDLFRERDPVAEAPRQPVRDAGGLRLPDADARARIERDLDASLLVEAGAGAGKTTAMAARMVALVRSGRARADSLAAVTFTRKAAAELRERFQTQLEKELSRAHELGDADLVERLDRALREIDRAFIGTIHSFCARMLRDRPLEAGLDPAFRETFAVEQERHAREFFAAHVDRLAAEGDPSLAHLAGVGLRPDQLRWLFQELAEHGDVEFPADPVPRPDPGPARAQLEGLLQSAIDLLPRREPAKGWDDFQATVRRLRFFRRVVGWDDDIRFLHALADSLAAVPKPKKGHWDTPAHYEAARALAGDFEAFATDGAGGTVLRQWWAHRYPLVIDFGRRAAAAFEAERVRTGALSFQDLLLCTARLLRTNATARTELGERFRWLLVDEFQDTDPIQAEVLLLLASAPGPHEGEPPDWRAARPRPGALFVVGDPKQSIYRFRRADVTIYNQVKRRFREFGDIVELTANFRSRPPIEAFVNRAFRERFPAEATAQQAAFAELKAVNPDREPQGVFRYRLEKRGKWPRHAELAEQDATRIASWIEMRVRTQERKPGDFLVLTRTKKWLTTYARAIEARNLPVQVTGAGISLAEELSELRLLLRALADPGDPVLTLAALVGLFFGLDFEQLAEHVLDRGRSLDFVDPPASPETAVDRARFTLHEMWVIASREPADVAIPSIVDRLGLLPFAAASELGESRAGALLYVLETIRAAALAGDASLGGALAAIDAALAADEAEAPLEPGRTDVVRVMNLHQAKGLEAPVVILAAPFEERDHPPRLHVTRPEQGRAAGAIVVSESRWEFDRAVLACPLDWPVQEQTERAFEAAERDRLLYVAATRAEEELLVSDQDQRGRSSWQPFYEHLDAAFPPIDLPETAPPERAHLERSAAEIAAEIERVEHARAERARPGWHAAAVRTRVKTEGAAAPAGAGFAAGAEAEAEDGDGMAWGRCVHAALEQAIEGAAGGTLRAICRSILVGEERPLDASGEPLELDKLAGTVEAVTRSDVWNRARAADVRLVEVPFSLAVPSAEYATLPGVRPELAAIAPVQVVDGVIDLVFRDAGGWTVVDYKSDLEGAGVAGDRRRDYRAQVDLYAACWERLTGEPVAGRILLFTTDGAAEAW
jgi:ATP-dependent helicase/nuclease subunit A